MSWRLPELAARFSQYSQIPHHCVPPAQLALPLLQIVTQAKGNLADARAAAGQSHEDLELTGEPRFQRQCGYRLTGSLQILDAVCAIPAGVVANTLDRCEGRKDPAIS